MFTCLILGCGSAKNDSRNLVRARRRLYRRPQVLQRVCWEQHRIKGRENVKREGAGTDPSSTGRSNGFIQRVLNKHHTCNILHEFQLDTVHTCSHVFQIFKKGGGDLKMSKNENKVLQEIIGT